MSRYFEPIDVREFKEKIAAHVNDGYIDYRHLTPTVDKDLSKVNFSTENMTDEKYKFGCGLVGYHRLSNGMPFYGVCAGGDWETPLLFIIYWDGKKLRGYIPENGNLWNTTTKEAYGNNNDADLRNARKRWPDDDKLKNMDADDLDGYFDEYDDEAMKNEIMERIIVKSVSKPQKSSKVREFSNEELLAELKRRLDNG